MSAKSRFAYLSNIENSVVEGDFTKATALIGTPVLPLVSNGVYSDSVTGVIIADDSTSDYIVNNYRMFYGVYMKYINGTLTCSDTSNLQYMAGLCPSIYGTVVYQSRALFTAVFGQLRVWNDDSCFFSPDTNYCLCGRNGRSAKIVNNAATQSDEIQQYQLTPNPNSGQFVLKQLTTDIAPVKIEIWNEIGQCIYQHQQVFENSLSDINIEYNLPGLYLLKLVDSRGRLFIIKFVVK